MEGDTDSDRDRYAGSYFWIRVAEDPGGCLQKQRMNEIELKFENVTRTCRQAVRRIPNRIHCENFSDINPANIYYVVWRKPYSFIKYYQLLFLCEQTSGERVHVLQPCICVCARAHARARDMQHIGSVQFRGI